MSRIWTSFKARIIDMHQAWSKHIFIVSIVAVAFGMLQKPLLTLLSFIELLCLAPLSPDWFGGLVLLLIGYLLKREWDYRKIYVPRPVSLWLILLLGIYLYYRHCEGSFSFWPISFSFWEIPFLRKLAWSDLLLIPWGGAVAIALRSRSKKDHFFLVLVLLVLCVVLYFVPQAQGKPSLVWPLLSLSMAVGSCLLLYFILYRWSYRLQRTREEYAIKVLELNSQAIGSDDAIESEEHDWVGFFRMITIVRENLQALDLSKGSFTVGVIAPWGRGKSSFINLLRKQLKKDGGIIIPFNPRGSKSVSSISEDFFDAFAKELSRHYLGFGLLLARYTKHLGLLNQYEWTRPLGSLLTLILPGKEQEAVNRILGELGKRVYVLLDDLDRLSGEEILEVLKLMDRNASFSSTVFIVAYDKAYVNNVLKKHLDHGLDHSFIDKYISWEIPLPAPSKEILQPLMGTALSMKVKGDYPTLREEIQRGWKKVGGTIIESLNSVRDLKRYLNLVIPRYNEMKEVVNPDECFLLYLLCYKDFGVYTALNSRRLLQLDIPSQTYVLAPNFEAELGLLSQWEGSKGILERLFSSGGKERSESVTFASLCHKRVFDIYFGYHKSEDSMPYADVVSKIIQCQYDQAPCKAIDKMMARHGVDLVVSAFLYLIQLPCRQGEDRSLTIKLMAYISFEDYKLEAWNSTLQYELGEFFFLDRCEKYKELRIIQDLDGYRALLAPMLSFVICTHPLRMFNLIEGFILSRNKPLREGFYTTAEIATIILECQRFYYSRWSSIRDIGVGARSFVFSECMNYSSRYARRAVLQLISLIREDPEGCIWMILRQEDEWLLGSNFFRLTIDESLLKLLEVQGFSLGTWRDLIEDSQCRYVLDYTWTMSEGDSFGYIKLLSGEKADLHSIDYVYRAVLAQEERERQQASSEG